MLHVTSCQVLQVDNSEELYHHHLKTCPVSQSRHETTSDSGLQKTCLLGQVSDTSQDHDYQLRHCSELSQSEHKTTASTMNTAEGLTSVNHGVDACPENSQEHHRHPVDGSVTCSNTPTGTDAPSLSCLLDPVCDERATNSQYHHHPHNVDGVKCQEVSAPDVDWFYLDRAVIAQLNDVFWVDSCLTTLQQFTDCHLLHQLIVFSQTPSMFPVAALRLGLVSNVCFLDLDPVHRPLIGRLLSANGLSEGQVTYGRPWQRDVTSVLFGDIVSSEGCLRQNVFESLTNVRSVCLYHLLVLPQR